MRHSAVIFASLVATQAAGDVSFSLPIDCTLGETCFIQQFVDHDPSTGASDFACGILTYDGHKGTDFALPSLNAQRQGVSVLAAADGIVARVRNDMPDILQGSQDAPDVRNSECGNGVVIRHTGGWETQYCHMAQGSLQVSPGQQVDMGDILGRVGLSGQTHFPHLHMSVRHNGIVVDPFDPDGMVTCGDISAETLWATPVPAPPGGIITAGFSDSIPAYGAIKAGNADIALTTDSPALVVWAYIFGPQAGDVLQFTMTAPDGQILIADRQTLDRTQAQSFRAIGKHRPAAGWQAGQYSAEIIHLRDGVARDSQRATTVITP